MTDYAMLNRQLESLIGDVPYSVTNLANAAALLWQELPDINWAGFYLLEDSYLILGPFQGKPACTAIPMGRGVCGTAASQNSTQLVADVHQFPGHIACDSASNAEIVIPLRKNNCVIGVLDIDSPIFNRFSEEDRLGLEAFAEILQQHI